MVHSIVEIILMQGESMAKKGSKNNIANRGTGAREKQLNGKTVIPVKMKSLKQGSFIAAQFKNGPLVTDKEGNFIPYSKIQ